MTCLGLLISTTVTVGKIGQDRGQNPTKSMVRLTAADTSCYGLVQETGQIVTDWQDAVKLSRRSEPLAAKFYRGRARIRVFVAVSQGGQPTPHRDGSDDFKLPSMVEEKRIRVLCFSSPP
ncbi:hypothetical protein N657DRAFT_635825 [Parathielavia appendiculata]|uniref:Uncharacterized protein n=1 Tax=Parathielavia appendiculata TaxID=2587402 RepID=A0AAN6TWK8_9PEZI|nr:hypothetical protein N657DRAFT_635825 [Parathielavia appendiculata]